MLMSANTFVAMRSFMISKILIAACGNEREESI